MLPLKNRLKKERDFQRVFDKGRFVASDLISVKFVGNGTDDTRVGFIVSKKVSKKAVLRNKIKRMLREDIKMKMDSMETGFDIIVIAKKGISEADRDKVTDDLEKTFKRSKLIR